MAEQPIEDETNYNAGKKVSVDQIMKMDQEDESLKKYKEALLGAAAKDVYSRKKKMRDFLKIPAPLFFTLLFFLFSILIFF
jgi:hypothetical protein